MLSKTNPAYGTGHFCVNFKHSPADSLLQFIPGPRPIDHPNWNGTITQAGPLKFLVELCNIYLFKRMFQRYKTFQRASSIN